MRYTLPRLLALASLTVAVLLAAVPAAAQPTFRNFTVDPLVSDLPGVAAFTDANLVNPWGLFQGTRGELWTANNGTGTSTAYRQDGLPAGITVTIPQRPGLTGPSSPTGATLNVRGGFPITSGAFTGSARAIFCTEEGTLAGYNPAVNATQAVLTVVGMYSTTDSPVYKGLALATDATGVDFLFVTDFRHDVVAVFDSNWNLVDTFTDTSLPSGYAPFGIHNVNGNLVVTFALQGFGGVDDVPGVGNGFVDVFDVDGTLLRRFAGGGTLNSPWGVTTVPRAFAGLPNVVLVGNSGDGRINAFDTSGFFLGQLGDEFGGPLEIEGLWSLVWASRPSPATFPTFFDRRTPSIYFTAGIVDETHGLFGKITPVSRTTFFSPFIMRR